MDKKLKIWDEQRSWEEAEEEWEKGAMRAGEEQPLKRLRCLPKMAGITRETARYLNWKSVWYMMRHDTCDGVFKRVMLHPWRYGWRFFRSLMQERPYHRDGDFFLYGIQEAGHFEQLLTEDKTLLVVGFSYCHKPFECPVGRFSDACIHDADHPVCRQCFIGKVFNALPDHEVVALAIPTIHYIGKKILDIVHAHPTKRVLFIITACELTLEMFGHWGNMAGIKGIGVRLDGRICNTMQAFEFSERGIKPGLTVVLENRRSNGL